jgi:hypothetical protein
LQEKIWFQRWITEGYSVRQLSLQSKHSRAKLYRIINYCLNTESPDIETNLNQYQYLLFDGTFLHRPICLVALMDATSNKIISGKYDIKETAERQLTSFFRLLKDRGLQPISFTVDGNPQAIKIIKTVWPEIVIQRCLVHIQRQGLSWCRISPKTAGARKLRALFLQITRIRTFQDRDYFLESLAQWEYLYGRDIHNRPEKGRVFSDIKRARSMLLKALPDMFNYLENQQIPSSTNSLEGYFSRLKGHYRQHRGLSKAKLESYFDWYFFFKQK